jgi:hypothetical protein
MKNTNQLHALIEKVNQLHEAKHSFDGRTDAASVNKRAALLREIEAANQTIRALYRAKGGSQ